MILYIHINMEQSLPTDVPEKWP